MSTGSSVKYSFMRHAKALQNTVFCLSVLFAASPLQANPARTFIGYTGKGWASDFGVLKGQCDAKLVQAEALKGQITGQMAHVEGQDSFRKLFPANQMVDAYAVDSHCFGHTMELVPSGQAVRWLNPVTGVGVYLSPGARSDSCRSFLGMTIVNGEKKKFRGDVCSPSKGVWQLQP